MNYFYAIMLKSQAFFVTKINSNNKIEYMEKRKRNFPVLTFGKRKYQNRDLIVINEMLNLITTAIVSY